MSKKATYTWVGIAEWLFPLVLLAFCLLLFFMGFRYQPRTRELPQIIAAITAAMLVAHLALIRMDRRDAKTVPMPRANKAALIYSLLAVPVFILILHFLGFIIASLVLVAALTYILGMRRTPVLVAVPIGATLFLYAVFGMLLGVPLPRGLIFQLLFH
ncbi:MAG: tripartite tricarboxylate transporter TctB family protein [Firmicutes bacterium]|nr:tripartite tricarboxylate transporter TctB family protein [Bacillota bacterium]